MNIEIITEITPSLAKDIEQLEEKIFPETYQPGRFTSELPGKDDPLNILAYDNGQLIGYKLGYKLKDNVFYSWLGGVVLEYRKRGLAQQMMDVQHKAVKERNYDLVRTNTRNNNPPMIIVNLKNNFNIIGMYQKSGETHLTITLEKKL